MSRSRTRTIVPLASRYTRTQVAPGEQVNNIKMVDLAIWRASYKLHQAILPMTRQVVPDIMWNRITLDRLDMASYYKCERQDK